MDKLVFFIGVTAIAHGGYRPIYTCIRIGIQTFAPSIHIPNGTSCAFSRICVEHLLQIHLITAME